VTFTRLHDCDLPDSHPSSLSRPFAYQCDVCGGISFHAEEPKVCPYCEEEE
jgi:rubrerythrin